MQAFRNARNRLSFYHRDLPDLMVVDLSGVTGGGSGFLTKTSVGSIDGQAIDSRAYQDAVQQAITQRQGQSGGNVGIEETESIRNEVWESFIQQAALRREIKRHKLTVSADEIAQAIATVPPPEVRTEEQFLTEGQFDMGKYRRWLGSAVGQQFVPVLESRYRDEILRAKLLRNITADVFLSDPALWERYRDQNEKVSILLTPILPRNVIPDSAVTVTPAEIDAHYAAHKADFSRPRTSYMSFVGVPRNIDASDTAAALARIRALRAEIQRCSIRRGRHRSRSTAGRAQGGELEPWPAEPGRRIRQGDLCPAAQHPVEPVQRSSISPIEVTDALRHAAARHILVPIGWRRAPDLVDALPTRSIASEPNASIRRRSTPCPCLRSRSPTGPCSGEKVQLGTYVIPDAAVWSFQASRRDVAGHRGRKWALRLPARLAP